MANNNVEIEIQVNIENSEPLIKFLKENGDFQSERHQRDEYFSPPHKDFLSERPVRELLRLRDSDGKYPVNYKNWHFNVNGKSNYCDEFETKVESIESIKNIISALDFKSVAVVDKMREVWNYMDFEISIDSVKNLGDFVEIEYIGKDKDVDPEEVNKEMIDFLKKMKCGKITRNYLGYPFLILSPDEAKYNIE